MKLNYEFEIIEIDGSYMACPVGEMAEKLHATLELNDVAVAMLKRIAESETPEEALKKLCADFPDEPEKEIGEKLCDFLNQLLREGLLTP